MLSSRFEKRFKFSPTTNYSCSRLSLGANCSYIRLSLIGNCSYRRLSLVGNYSCSRLPLVANCSCSRPVVDKKTLISQKVRSGSWRYFEDMNISTWQNLMLRISNTHFMDLHLWCFTTNGTWLATITKLNHFSNINANMIFFWCLITNSYKILRKWNGKQLDHHHM